MPELSIIVPTFNESTNIEPLFRALDASLNKIDFEVIFVDDDSPDGTAHLARCLAQSDKRIRVLQRIHRKGLASAVVEGMMSSSAPYLAVIDADLQHDETILPKMFHKLKTEHLDLVIASRNTDQGSMGHFSPRRIVLSNLGKQLSRSICHEDISDPMSGFFVMDRKFLDETVRFLSMTGFKILIDLVSSSPRRVRFAEVGYEFRKRLSGDSKLDIVVGLEYLKLVADRLLRGWVPINYVLFSAVGAVGVMLHLTLVFLFLQVFGLKFIGAQAASSSIVIAINFLLNNSLTFRAYRLRGLSILAGLTIFYLACSIGLLTNVWVAGTLRSGGVPWYLAGFVGIAIGSVWNYWVTSLFVWRVNRPRRSVA